MSLASGAAQPARVRSVDGVVAVPSIPQRWLALDVLRGLAIALMVPANASALLLADPHPLGVRVLFSLAAPTFVLLSGLMVGLSAMRSSEGAGARGLPMVLARGGFIVLVGAFVDVAIGGYLPLLTCDVLYAIGLSLPVCWLATRLPWPWRLGLAILVLGATPLAQQGLGYRVSLDSPSLEMLPDAWSALVSDACRRFLVDGWFPLFPWLGFALLGTALGSCQPFDGVIRRAGQIGLPLLLVGGALWWFNPGPMAQRCGYSEIFYPPVPGFLVGAAGGVLILMRASQRLGDVGPARALAILGRCSLLLYIVHLVVIQGVSRWVDERLGLVPFLLLNLLILGSLVLVAISVAALKRLCRERGLRLPGVAAVLLGA